MKRAIASAPRILSQVGRHNSEKTRKSLETLFSKGFKQNGLRILSRNCSTFTKCKINKPHIKDQSALNLYTSAQPQVKYPLAGARAEGSLKEAVEVQWKSGEITHYPYLWLRDNCYCPKCKKQGRDVFQRDFLMQDLNPNSAPKDVMV